LLAKYDQPEIDERFNTFAFRYKRNLQIQPQGQSLLHTADVIDMDAWPDQNWLASGDIDGNILVRSMLDGHEVTRLRPVEKEITRLRFSPDGKWLATTGQEAAVRVWRTDNWELHCRIPLPGSTINGLSWSPDSHRLAFGNRVGNLIVWDVQTNRRVKSLPRLTGRIRTLVWSPDGSMLCNAEENYVNIWNTEDWRRMARFAATDDDSGVLHVEFSPDSRTVACGGYFGHVTLFDLEKLDVVQRLSVPVGAVQSIAYMQNEGLLVGLDTGSIRYFRRSRVDNRWYAKREVRLTPMHEKIGRLVYLPKDRKIMALLQSQREWIEITVDALAGFERLECTDAMLGVFPERNLQVVRWAEDGLDVFRILDQNSSGSTIKLNELKPDRVLPLQVNPECRPVWCGANDLLAVGGYDQEGPCIGLFDLSDDCRIRSRLAMKTNVRQLCFSPDGELLVANGQIGDLLEAASVLYSTATAEQLPFPRPFEGELRCLFVEPSGLMVVGALITQNLACLNYRTGEVVNSVSLASNFNTMAFDSKNQLVLVGQASRLSCYTPDLSQQVWSVASPEMIVEIAICSEHRVVFCLGYDGVVRLWDMASREWLYELPYTAPAPLTVLHSHWLAMPDSDTLLFGNVLDNQLIRFRAPPNR
jgi:WD40 repeat protein